MNFWTSVLAVFIAGLMVGRTPEYLGKKIESREIKIAMLPVIGIPVLILGFLGYESSPHTHVACHI